MKYKPAPMADACRRTPEPSLGVDRTYRWTARYNRNLAPAIASLLATALALLAAACGGDGNGSPSATATAPPATGQGSQHVLGSVMAPLNLVEYADFQ